eukprot:TRINITY_DN3021_c0_g1_i2.p1 TRINITY_DN3021_c0_g1~~TRINITY_DN3021_c0_g1_i2.p1  ORF type:complete len:216 (-),score=34.42 TRINITY_DN3021_c0_g1_i2:19-666(-)
MLQKHEIHSMNASNEIRLKIVKSYELMLKFFGIHLADIRTGRLQKTTSYRTRYKVLNDSNDYHPVVTRMLKSIGEYGLEDYQYCFIMHLMREVFTTKELKSCANVLETSWLETYKGTPHRRNNLLNQLRRHRNTNSFFPVAQTYSRYSGYSGHGSNTTTGGYYSRTYNYSQTRTSTPNRAPPPVPTRKPTTEMKNMSSSSEDEVLDSDEIIDSAE